MTGTAHAEGLTVTDARLSLMPGDTPGAGYFHLHNGGDAPVTLVGADSDAFARVEMHMSMNKDGMASMKPISELTIDPGETLDFAPKGYHLMFMKRQGPLGMGDKVDVTLDFADDTRLPVVFDVVSPASL
ncbi:copper chaperone PCu(A)C [Modicisalibacter tunisiensis]|nr:copper chaperone PCu(A)C [Modicisalibacter tunisiensis]